MVEDAMRQIRRYVLWAIVPVLPTGYIAAIVANPAWWTVPAGAVTAIAGVAWQGLTYPLGIPGWGWLLIALPVAGLALDPCGSTGRSALCRNPKEGPAGSAAHCLRVGDIRRSHPLHPGLSDRRLRPHCHRDLVQKLPHAAPKRGYGVFGDLALRRLRPSVPECPGQCLNRSRALEGAPPPAGIKAHTFYPGIYGRSTGVLKLRPVRIWTFF